MINLEKLRNLPTQEKSYESLIGYLVVIEPGDIVVDEQGNPQDWRWLTVYVIQTGEPLKGWKRQAQSDCLELNGRILSDVKSNGLICDWSPIGQVEVHGSSTLQIDALDSAEIEPSLSSFEQN